MNGQGLTAQRSGTIVQDRTTQTSVGLSDVATGRHPFVTDTVLDPAIKAIFQTTSGQQRTIT